MTGTKLENVDARLTRISLLLICADNADRVLLLDEANLLLDLRLKILQDRELRRIKEPA